jgi:hypothetical protein
MAAGQLFCLLAHLVGLCPIQPQHDLVVELQRVEVILGKAHLLGHVREALLELGELHLNLFSLFVLGPACQEFLGRARSEDRPHVEQM